MRPLIPRVRVGDVLRGTRNLRHYLQTAATLNYLTEISHSMSGRSSAKSRNLYHPGKDDEFLVAVNAWGTFGVYGLNGDVVLLFRNASPAHCEGARRKGRVPMPPPGGYSRFMNPTIFSKWFIRTREKQVDLESWPKVAYFMWAALHLNLSSIRSDSAPNFYCQNGPTGPFAMHGNHRPWKKDQLQQMIREWTVRGSTRAGAYSGKGIPIGGFGPRLEEITSMRREIENLCSNPRLASRLKLEDNNIYSAFVENQ